MKKILLIFILTTSCLGAIQDSTLSLPIYSIEINPLLLDDLNENPLLNNYYSAQLILHDTSYVCKVRYRGATSRELPKKSWRIKFPDKNNPFKSEHINLNAEYRDKTILRNMLGFSLFQSMGYMAPNTDFISLKLNENYMGVYLQVDDLDDSFLLNRNRKVGNIYKGRNHGARMAPIVHDENIEAMQSWKLSFDANDSSTELKKLFNGALYWSNEEFNWKINEVIDVDDLIGYFAIQFVITNGDGYSKNMVLYNNHERKLFEIIAWDLDASFGSDWQGNYNSNYVKSISFPRMLRAHLVFNRLMKSQLYVEEFKNKINIIINNKLPQLLPIVDSAYSLVKNDILKDPFLELTELKYENHINNLRNFINTRPNNLSGFIGFSNSFNVFDAQISTAFLTSNEREVTFKIKSDVPRSIKLNIANNVKRVFWQHDAAEASRDINSSRFDYSLNDNGTNGDLVAGDLEYTTTVSIPTSKKGLMQFAFADDGLFYPEHGLEYIDYIQTNSFALISTDASKEDYLQLEILGIINTNEETIIPIANNSEKALDLSYCHLRTNDVTEDIIFPTSTLVSPHDTILVSSNINYAAGLFNKKVVNNELFFKLTEDDSLHLLSPVLNHLVSSELIKLSTPTISESPQIVINEINYHSSENFNSEDWLELYNPNSFSVDLSGWILKDSKDSNVFVIPYESKIEPNNYFVICKDSIVFKKYYNTNAKGNLDFGFNASGELIRLYNFNNQLIDSLTYDDNFPWPKEPDGFGNTLELINWELDNSKPQNWQSSYVIGGTPGKINSDTTLTSIDTKIKNERFYLAQNYPNPFNPETTINYLIPKDSHVTLLVYNALGQKVITLVDKEMTNGAYSVTFNGKNLSSGIYFYTLKTNDIVLSKKMLIIK